MSIESPPTLTFSATAAECPCGNRAEFGIGWEDHPRGRYVLVEGCESDAFTDCQDGHPEGCVECARCQAHYSEDAVIDAYVDGCEDARAEMLAARDDVQAAWTEQRGEADR